MLDHLPFDPLRVKTMTTKPTSIQLIELIWDCEKTANEILRRDHCNLMLKHVLSKSAPKFKIEIGAMDAIQVRLQIQIYHYVTIITAYFDPQNSRKKLRLAYPESSRTWRKGICAKMDQL